MNSRWTLTADADTFRKYPYTAYLSFFFIATVGFNGYTLDATELIERPRPGTNCLASCFSFFVKYSHA